MIMKGKPEFNIIRVTVVVIIVIVNDDFGFESHFRLLVTHFYSNVLLLCY